MVVGRFKIAETLVQRAAVFQPLLTQELEDLFRGHLAGVLPDQGHAGHRRTRQLHLLETGGDGVVDNCLAGQAEIKFVALGANCLETLLVPQEEMQRFVGQDPANCWLSMEARK